MSYKRYKEKMKTKNKRNYLKQNGITLIALVVTIVVLLILAGVSLNAIFSENGIIKRAQDAQNKMDQATQNDLDAINGLNELIDSKTNGTTGGNNNPSTTPKVSTLIGKVVDKNTKAEDAYGNKITIPKGFKILAHSENTTTGDVTYTYSGDKIPAVQDGIVIENGTDGNQFVWVPVGTIKNKDNTTNTIALGRYEFDSSTGALTSTTPVQRAEDYNLETEIKKGQKENYTVAKLNMKDEEKNKIKIDKAIQIDLDLSDVKIMKSEAIIPNIYKELTTSRDGSKGDGSENATARNLKEFISTTLVNGGYYIARYEASGTTEKITSKYDQTVLTNITQPNAAKLAREMYGEVKENNELVYASDLVNRYAWDTAIIFIQTYSTETDASSYASQNKSTSFANTGKSNDKYCNIFDMSGNAYEWTTEYSANSVDSDFCPCVPRGGLR